MFVALSLVSVSALSVVAGLNSQPVVFSVQASADTTLSTFYADEPQGSSDTLWVSNANGQLNWTLLLFNVAGKMRPGDLVTDARVQLFVAAASGSGFPGTIVTGRLLTAWSEQTATFETKPLMAFDTRTATLVREMPQPGDAIWIDVTKQLNRWHIFGGPSSFGTVLMVSNDVVDMTVGFSSREDRGPDSGVPRIQVKYTPGPKSLYGYGVHVDLGLVELAAAVRLE